ncbi:MAG: DUF1926 domain-containing protein [Elusimicrobia bacterium]|nr:DUF1926 domain-containing protein [Elusimicrobiota bacterium]
MVKFIFALHNHQPVGNFDEVFARAYEFAYLPFVNALKSHPSISFSMHFSGILYDWLEKNRSGYFETLKEMSSTGRLEIIGGAYYEPILAIIPPVDQAGQIKMMRDYIEKKFSRSPRGMWLAERVWEPQLAAVLADAQAEYAVLDDSHFFSAGLQPDSLSGYFYTEFSGKSLKVFPINHKLRYMIPFSDPEKSIEYLKTFNETGATLVMADDGEKFGMWPKTHELIYRKGWLEKFLNLLEQNSGWLKTATFSDCLDSEKPKGLVYLQTGSYYELTQWALPPEASARLSKIWKNSPDEQKPFLRGGYFRNFFSKYPESNRLYLKMLKTSAAVHSVAPGSAEARTALWKAQCNCGYWHGVFGGIYLPHIRREIYKNLITAETIAHNNGDDSPFRILLEDWDYDGEPEIFVECKNAFFALSPAKGGGLWEWDYRPGRVNWLSVMSRHKEAYHGEAPAESISVHEAGSAAKCREKIFQDWHLRMCLLDHFLHPGTSLDNFESAQYGEQGDFTLAGYSVDSVVQGKDASILLSREGSVWENGKKLRLRIEKNLTFKTDASWSAQYSVRSLNDFPAHIWFGSEFAFGFSEKQACLKGAENSITEKVFSDRVYGNLKLVFDRPVDLWSFPIETASRSESGLEKTYQGSVLLANVKTSLQPGEVFKMTVQIMPYVP